jgi:MFS superfamily sulfate permease-like transporter
MRIAHKEQMLKEEKNEGLSASISLCLKTKYLVGLMPLFLIFISQMVLRRVHLYTVILLVGCMVVWT